MNKSTKRTSSKLEIRANLIKYIYQFELLNQPLSTDLAFESGDFTDKQIKALDKIGKNKKKYITLIQKFISKNWSWNRISPLERSILIYGAFELSFNDKALVINELVMIARGYIPGDSHKFINAILDKVGSYYESIKRN